MYLQGLFRMGLERNGDSRWHLTYEPSGGISRMSWTTPARQADFEEQHTCLDLAAEIVVRRRQRAAA